MLIKTLPWNENVLSLLQRAAWKANVFLLDSSLQGIPQGRYSFFGFDPFLIIRHSGEKALEQLKEAFHRYSSPELCLGETPLPCGIVGYLSYDFGLRGQRFKQSARDDIGLPDCCFGFYDVVCTIDHLKGVIHIASSGLPEKSFSARQGRARRRLEEFMAFLSIAPKPLHDLPLKPLEWQANFTQEQYLRAVESALERIACGDIYQVNLSQRFDARLPGADAAAYAMYAHLRAQSPSNFSAFFNGGDFQILSTSPERFLTLRDGVIETRPMKGTRPRGRTIQEDAYFKNELLNSPKEIAELLMVTDLERNDLGKVCEFGSVRVKDMRVIEEYKHVFQASAVIEGRLARGRDAFDALGAAFPGGSITGCPKIKAMEIIDGLEPTCRGVYTGALGYISFSGNMDFNVLIRTLLFKGDHVYLQAGGGIVADSQPQAEYDETLLKVRAIRQVVDGLFQQKLFSADSNLADKYN